MEKNLALLGIIVGWIMALFVEKRYINRGSQLGVISCAFAPLKGYDFLNKFWETSDFWLAWNEWEISTGLKIYLCLGLLLGCIAFLCYVTKIRCSTEFYKISYWLYSSKTVMPLATTLFIFSNWWPELLYGVEFWVTCIGFFFLSWFTKITLIAICIVCITIYLVPQ